MASFTLSPDQRFPPGTTLRAYPGDSSSKVTGAQTTSAVVASDSTTTFTGLDNGQRYLAGTSTVGPFTAFSTPPADNLTTTTLLGFCLWSGTAWTHDDEVITSRPAFDGKLFWLGGGPSADPTPEGLAYSEQGDVWIPSEAVD